MTRTAKSIKGDRNRDEKLDNIEKKVRCIAESKKGTFEENDKDVKTQCLSVLRVTNFHMKDVAFEETKGARLRVLPTTTKECRDWQGLSKGYDFPFAEPGLDRDYGVLRGRRVTTSAMADLFGQVTV